MIGAGQCPVCRSTRVRSVEQDVVAFYAATLEVCGGCGAAWEPVDPAQLLCPAKPAACFREPCGNCAFREGSHERSDADRWSDLLLRITMHGGRFYCHKGVPLTPGEGPGFAYPKDPRQLRLCRGFVDAFSRLGRRRMWRSLKEAMRP